ncbi:MAG: zinc protease, partial [Bacteroides sp.]|nr:zinc protease [Bacteroides sp.]
MEKNYKIEDAELGTITWKVNPRARRLTFRTKPEGVFATVPVGTTQKEVEKAIEELRPKLQKAKEKAKPKPLIDLNYRIDAEYFKLSLVNDNRERFLS